MAALVVLVAGAAAIVVARGTAAIPAGSVRQTLPRSRLVGTERPSIVTWPAGVQAAVGIPSLGLSTTSGPETSVPIASLTKLMTAHIILTDHPLAPGQDGPSVSITAADVAEQELDVDTDQANVAVAVGEVLTERQLLEGLLIHSANNFAVLLADWDAGSVPAFVAKMNAAAKALGMTQTSYADASGLSTQSVSTPADQLRLATLVTQNPVVDQIVDSTSVTLPVAGTVSSYTPLIGVDGVVGVKSGYTSAAGGCDVLALVETTDGVPVQVLSVVTGVQGANDVLAAAGFDAYADAHQAVSALELVRLASPGQRVGVASVAGHSTAVVARTRETVLTWPGERVTARLRVNRPPPAGAPAGWRVGSLTIVVGAQRRTVPIVTASRLPSPSFFQRVF